MKKKLAILLSVLSLGVLAFSSCTVRGSSSSTSGSSSSTSDSSVADSSTAVQIPAGRTYISRFDRYEDLCLWSNSLSDSRYDETDWWSSWNTVSVNKEADYIREGEGSMFIKTDIINKVKPFFYKTLKTHPDNPARGTQANSIHGAQSVGLDVYNSSAYTLRVKVTISTVTTSVMTFQADCLPNQWTTISAPAASEVEATIDNYRLDVQNMDGAYNFELYLDNFYIQFPEN